MKAEKKLSNFYEYIEGTDPCGICENDGNEKDACDFCSRIICNSEFGKDFYSNKLKPYTDEIEHLATEYQSPETQRLIELGRAVESQTCESCDFFENCIESVKGVVVREWVYCYWHECETKPDGFCHWYRKEVADVERD